MLLRALGRKRAIVAGIDTLNVYRRDACSSLSALLSQVVKQPQSDLHTFTSCSQQHQPVPQHNVKPLFKKILVANRGEIAVRVMRSARRLGIPTVAVYSHADANSVHTRFADEAVCIGPPPSTQSYLNIDAIVKAIKETGADAVHPGYGFLSENENFARAVEEAGATFIGPPANAVRAMGDKVESKRFAKEAGVNTIPGWIGVVDGPDHAVQVAKEIGFPVMVKASAGGGGKGMRIAWDEKELYEGYELATQEAASSFGDSRMLIEKFVVQPRHIEIQVIGDKHGNVIYLPERECSIQRRNQKVIEEAPSPVGTPELRKAMGEQAAALCRAVGYYSAGTCEFLVDIHKNFYFLEMNTRLQVEHPITEAITGLDLVEQMIHVAAGHKLELVQDQVIKPKGWAMECRVYAEDPARGFLPSTGRLKRYIEPKGHNVRVDSGVQEGSDISVYYDPMICKLVTYGQDRTAALETARHALDTYVIRGVQHNAPLLRSVLDAPDFVAGNFSTAFLAEHFPTPESSAPAHLPLTPEREQEVLGMSAALFIWRELQLGDGLDGETVELVVNKDTVVKCRHAPTTMVASPRGEYTFPPLEIELPDRVMQVSVQDGSLASPVIHGSIDNKEAVFQVLHRDVQGMTVQYAGAQRTVSVATPMHAQLAPLMPPPKVEDFSRVIRSPMPGTLVALKVQVGDDVEAGDEVAVVEAMKMRNVLRSGANGKVASIGAKEGSSVAADEVIVKLE